MTIGDVGKAVGDIASVGVLIGTIAQWLPSIAAVFTVLWTAIQIYESRTVQGWLGRNPSN
jgi:chromate transport protein ChrA